MKITIKANNLNFENYGDYRIDEITIDPPSLCPICHKSGAYGNLYSCVYEKEDADGDLCNVAYVLNLCRHCDNCFFSVYHDEYDGEFYLCETHPETVENIDFEEVINSISPEFVSIYSQANKAEQEGLDKIAGLGYRKALEFLVKDFCKKQHPKDTAKIEQMSLSSCIKDYIDHQKTKDVAERAAWLGNDHAHYLKKHTDRDLNDLKLLIKLTRHWIALELETTVTVSKIKARK